MIVKEISLSEDTLEKNDYQDMYEIEVNGDTICHFSDGEPEDNTISRNFNDIYNIKKLIQMAFDAGRTGEILEFISEDYEEED